VKRSLRWFLICLLCVPAIALGAAPGDRVDNFRLLDHTGASHELYYLSDAKAVVLMAFGNGCPIVRHALPGLRELRDRYRKQGVEFLLVDSNRHDDRVAITEEVNSFAIDFPILIDQAQLIGESLALSRTAEVLVIDPKGWKLAYRGPIDDRLSYGAQKPAAREHYLADALEAVLAGRTPATTRVDPVGCLLDLPGPADRARRSTISYGEQIAPLLKEKCVTCHRAGGAAPFAMNRYETVRGFAPMIREVIRTKRMPPWHADPHYGSFAGDRSLSDEQAKMLVHWVEAGAKRGDGPDPLASAEPVQSVWTLGTPDLVVEVPAFEVPATGVVDYQYARADNPLDRDVWIRAVEILPGDRSVVHHALAGLDDPANGSQRAIRGQIGELGGYAPGLNAVPYPEGTGILLRKEADFRFQMHYTPIGKAATDVTRIGLYFAKEPPQHRLQMAMFFDTSLSIPPHAKAYSQSVEHVFDRDVMIYSLMPHAHLRGKAAKFTAHYPDGRQEVLLSIPKYDFAWQTIYALRQPKPVPAGARIVLDMTWDNSAQNPANPDPEKEVTWGDQTWDEMNVGWVRYRDAQDGEVRVGGGDSYPSPRPSPPRGEGELPVGGGDTARHEESER